MKTHPLAWAAVLGMAADYCLAQGLPGLWEVTQKMGGNPEMEKAMAAMPAAERKQMEADMGSKGMSMPGAGDGGTVVKTCVSREMVDRPQIPMQGDCTSSMVEKTGTSSRMKFTCTITPSSGEGQFTFVNDKTYTMKMKINSMAGGKPQIMTIGGAGKWLGADCGSIKPLVVPTK